MRDSLSTSVPQVASATRLAALKKAASYHRWRATVPYTDAQLLAAFDRVIAAHDQTNPAQAAMSRRARAWFDRRRRLSAPLLKYLLPYLVDRCELCGERALYVYGYHGRCAMHKGDVPQYVLDRRARLDRAQVERIQVRRQEDARLLAHHCAKQHAFAR